MPKVTLTEPPAPFNCTLCSMPQWQEKAGNSCKVCPSFKGTHYYPADSGVEGANLIVVGDVPAPPSKLTLIGGTQVRPQKLHPSFDDSAGRVIKAAVNRVLSRREFSALQVLYTYAVKCAVDNPNKKTVVACSENLRAVIRKAAERRKQDGLSGPIGVLACGVDALIALGVNVRSEDQAINRVFEDVEVGGVKVSIAFTRSLKSLGTQDGKFNTLLFDIERAAQLATGSMVHTKSREEISKDYVYPRSIEEVRSIVDHIIAYTENGVDPVNWKISADTETNTLHPNEDTAKLLLVSIAWSKGKAVAIPLWHPENNFLDPALAFEEVKRLFASQKPVIWFNGKYDYKVFWKYGWPQTDVGNVYWDAFLAEHVLEEDKKRFYSLKQLTKQYLPELAGYEDKLHDLLEKDNDLVEVETPAETEEKDETKELKLPAAVAEAYAALLKKDYVKGPRFRVSTLKKVAETLEANDPLRASITLVVNAKDSGLFRAGASEKKSNKKKETGGFESIPLDELSFYACVDVDATRQIAVIQVKRMAEEDARLAEMRKQVLILQKFSKDPRDTQFPVEVLCTYDRPLFRLAQSDYLPRQRELAKIEYNGMKVDMGYLTWGMSSLDQTIEHTRNQIYEIAEDDSFKLGSGKKLAQLFFGEGYKHPDPKQAEELAQMYPELVTYRNGKISYKAQAYTEKGAIQTSDGVLKGLVTKYKCPLANLFLAYKKADKAKNTFFENIRLLALYFGDGKLHSGYGLTSTSTGRLASSVAIGDARFNAQNIPKGYIGALKDLTGALILNEQGKAVFDGVNCKRLFIPDDDSYCFGNADAKGAEVSIYSAYSKDAALIAALVEGLDAHCYFGSQCLNPALVAAGLTGEARRIALAKAGIDDDHAWSYEDFYLGKDGKLEDKAYGKRLKALRDNIKRLVFGMLYGAGIRKIAEIAGIPFEFAKQIQELLFTKFPTIRTFMDRTKWELRTFGMVEAFNGRRRRFLIGKNAPNDLRAQAERRAINFKVQGTNSDIVLSVLCWIAPVIERDLRGRLLLTVHDSIGFQVPKKYAHQVREIFTEYGTKRVAQAFPWMPVPYRWDVELGPNYGQVTGAEEYCAGLPPMLPEPELEGYTEEERTDDLRDPDAFESPDRRTPLKKKGN